MHIHTHIQIPDHFLETSSAPVLHTFTPLSTHLHTQLSEALLFPATLELEIFAEMLESTISGEQTSMVFYPTATPFFPGNNSSLLHRDQVAKHSRKVPHLQEILLS